MTVSRRRNKDHLEIDLYNLFSRTEERDWTETPHPPYEDAWSRAMAHPWTCRNALCTPRAASLPRPRMFGQSKWKLLAEPASTGSALLTNTQLACSLAAGDSSWSPVCLSLKGHRGRKNQQSGRLARTEKPSPVGPAGTLYRRPAPNITSPQRCHRVAERTRE